ncbi:MAG: hypothetical protein P8Z78_10635 [Gammaproteobacteria bacterium]|jgi:hypothetical protein
MGGLTLTAAYILPLLLVTWLWLGSNARPPVKLAVTLLLPLFYLLHWHGIEQTRGWPAHEPLPERFRLIAADVIEPGRGGHDAGVIHLLIRPGETSPPRLHALPYSRELHTLLFEARERIAAGRPQIGILRDSGQAGSGAPVGPDRSLEFIDSGKRRLLPPKS